MKEPETMFQFIPSWNISNNFPSDRLFSTRWKKQQSGSKQKKQKKKKKTK